MQEEYKELLKETEKQKKEGIQNSEEQQLLKSISQKSELIKQGIENRNPYGEKIQQKDTPKQLSFVGPLWKVKLTGFWRMLYTIDSSNRPEIVAFILEILDHNKYNKLFHRKE